MIARTDEFERYLRVDRGFAPITARQRRNIVRRFLHDWNTLSPSRNQVQVLKEKYVMDGFDRDYARNICLAFRNYGEFTGQDLAVRPPSKPKARMPRFLTEQEVQALLYSIDSVRDRALFTLMAYSGLRVSELVNLAKDDLGFAHQTLTVRNGKGGKSAEIPIARVALEAVSAYLRSGLRLDHSPILFPDPAGKPLSTNRIRVLIRRYGRRAGIQKQISPHQLRHALATSLLSRGMPLPFVQRQLRHSRIETTLIYLHCTDQHLKENYERFLPNY